MKWTQFWWESNAGWGRVASLEDWRAMVARSYPGNAAMMLDHGCVATTAHLGTIGEVGDIPSIGLRMEHIGGKPFRAWLAEQGMDAETMLTDVPK